MRVAIARTRWMVLALGLAAAWVGGCSNPECLDCEGNDPCPVFQGTYECVSQGSLDTCQGWNLLEGSGLVFVNSQFKNEIEIQLTDSNGLWGLLTGQICNTDQQTSPRSYSFYTSYDLTPMEVDFQIYYTLSGYFVEPTASAAAHIEANLMLQLYLPETAQANCTLTGRLTGDRVE